MTAIGKERHDRQTVENLIAGYQLFLRRRVDAGWRAHLLTMTFRQLPGPPHVVLSTMLDAAEHFYRRLLTRVVRRPRASRASSLLPVLIVVPDLPVGKHDKPLRSVVVNGGMHLHGILVLPPRHASRLQTPLDEHVRTEEAFYLGQQPRRLAGIDVRPVVEGFDEVVSYAMKGIARRRFQTDDILVLPRASSELTDHLVEVKR